MHSCLTWETMPLSSEEVEQLYHVHSLLPGEEGSFHGDPLHSKASCHLCLVEASDMYWCVHSFKRFICIRQNKRQKHTCSCVGSLILTWQQNAGVISYLCFWNEWTHWTQGGYLQRLGLPAYTHSGEAYIHHCLHPSLAPWYVASVGKGVFWYDCHHAHRVGFKLLCSIAFSNLALEDKSANKLKAARGK